MVEKETLFRVKKAKSRNTNVEYVEISLGLLQYFLENTIPNEIETTDKQIEETYCIPISPKATIHIKKRMTKAKRMIKSIYIGIEYIAYQNLQQEEVKWESYMNFDRDKHFLSGNNYGELKVQTKNTHKGKRETLFIVFDGGFSAEKMDLQPYFLNQEQFDYVYEKIN